MTSCLFQIATPKSFDQNRSALKIVIFFAIRDLRRTIFVCCCQQLENWPVGKWRALREFRQQYVDPNKKAAPSEWCGPICAGEAAGPINART
jgi:hypothetical protein